MLSFVAFEGVSDSMAAVTVWFCHAFFWYNNSLYDLCLINDSAVIWPDIYTRLIFSIRFFGFHFKSFVTIGKLEERYLTERSLLGIRNSVRSLSRIPIVGAVSLVMSRSIIFSVTRYSDSINVMLTIIFLKKLEIYSPLFSHL